MIVSVSALLTYVVDCLVSITVSSCMTGTFNRKYFNVLLINVGLHDVFVYMNKVHLQVYVIIDTTALTQGLQYHRLSYISLSHRTQWLNYRTLRI